MPSGRLKSSLTDGSAFVVIAELCGGPGYNFGPIETFLASFRDTGPASVPEGFDFVGIAVPQNPGGIANIAPTDVLAKLQGAALLGPLDFIPHISCKDHNRDGLTSSLVGYRARGVRSVLALTGDKPVSAQGVFDIESVGLLQLIQRMNCQSYLQAKPDDLNSVKQFFAGAAVSCFKYTEASQMQQYYKMEKKITCGAGYLTTQVGWDWKKSLELMQYMEENGLDTPVLGNVYLLSTVTPAPRLMHDGKLPGCFVSDELYGKLASESPDLHIERAAQQVAMYKSIGAAGVDLGGVHDYATFCRILTQAAEIGGDWEKHKDNLCWPRENGFYLYERAGKMVSLSTPRKSLGHRTFNAAHRVIDADKRVGAGKGVMNLLGAGKGKGVAYKLFNATERWLKYLTFDCEDCGDCYLPENFGHCTLGKCMKGLANAPCGDSTADGMCGNDLERVCVGDLIYGTASSERDGRERLRKTINDPRNPSLQCSSSILNYLFANDHTRKSPLTSIGDAIHAAFPAVGGAMRRLRETGGDAYVCESGPLNYIKTLIQSQADERATYIALSIDALDKKDAGLAASVIGEYVKLVRKWGKGVAVCIDSNNTEVLTNGLAEWYNTRESVAAPLLIVGDSNSVDAVIALRKEYDFDIAVRLTPGQDRPEAVELVQQAGGFFDKAVAGGFKSDRIFFELPMMSLAQDIPAAADAAGHTYCTLEAIKAIKADLKLKKCHCVLRVEFSADGLPRKVGVCRAFVAKAMEYGLDTAISNVTLHYGESGADAKLVKLVDAYAKMDGSSGRADEAALMMQDFCAAAKKPAKKPQSRIKEQPAAKTGTAEKIETPC